MTRPIALLALLLAGCAQSGPGQRPGTDYHIRTPQEIVELACRSRIHDCRNVQGITFTAIKPCSIFVPPLTASTAWVWKHEEEHCDNPEWHETRMDR